MRGTLLRFRYAVTLAALITMPLALGACGGDDDDSSADEDQITTAIEAAAVSGDPVACTEAQTQNFLEQTIGATGEDAVKQCEEEAAETIADEVEVSNVEIDGDTATADAAVTGSVFDGQTLELALVNDGDQWKLDDFVGFAEFDRDALTASFIENVQSDPQASPQVVDCLEGQFEQVSDEELQSFFTEPESSVGEEIFGPCFGQ
jgi:hypothetical protein